MTGKLIGIVGYKGSGKSTTVNCATNGINHFHHMGFSEPIYRMLEAMGIPKEILDDKSRWNEPLDILCGKSTRYAFTTLGTEWGRDLIDGDVWTHIALEKADRLRNRNINVIIDNVRFPSEFDHMLFEGATMIAFHRPELEVDLSHESERHIRELQSRCKYFITNPEGEFTDTVSRMISVLNGICFIT